MVCRGARLCSPSSHSHSAGVGLGHIPYLVVPDLTVSDAAASGPTLELLLWSLAIGGLLLFPSLYYLYRIFKAHTFADTGLLIPEASCPWIDNLSGRPYQKHKNFYEPPLLERLAVCIGLQY